jgi:hypothetical protein
MATGSCRRDPVGIRLITRRGNDWTIRFPLVVEAVNHLTVRSCLIDGELVCCDERACRRSTSSGGGATRRWRSSTPSTCWSWTARTCGGPQRGAPGNAGEHLAESRPGVGLNEHWSTLRAMSCAATLQAGRRGHHLEETWFSLPIRAVARLAQVKNSEAPQLSGRLRRVGSVMSWERELADRC